MPTKIPNAVIWLMLVDRNGFAQGR